ncbi:MAG: aspartate ammonia-lyase [Candidatus Diapherotrites archaeon]
MAGFRIELDSLGKAKVPEEAYFGVFTARAIQNFQISGLMPSMELMKSLGQIKLACAEANHSLKLLESKKFNAIKKSCNELIKGKFVGHFLLDYFQAGAGTSFNMNANEILANRATEFLGGKKGQYLIHPNNDVNMSQSSNDVMPSVVRLAILMHSQKLKKELTELKNSFEKKSKEFNSVLKCGRTHFMDAVPITLGQEFFGYVSLMDSALNEINEAEKKLLELPLGGTAVGTGINTHPDYRKKTVLNLRKISGFRFVPAKNQGKSFELMHSMNSFVSYSNALKMLSNSLIKISNDLMLLNSGPNAGLNEIILPAVQPGSSIMPGKINPSILEATKMACFYAEGMDLTVNRSAQEGVLEINVFTPVILYSLESSIQLLSNSMKMLSDKCIKGIKANKKQCMKLLEESHSYATALNPYLGYFVLARLIKEANEKNKPIKEAILEKNFISEKELSSILSFNALIKPVKLNKKLIYKIKENNNYKNYLNLIQ